MEPEMGESYRERALKLLFEVGGSMANPTPELLLSAYRAVLESDLLFAVNSLLDYKRMEVHR